jgi:tRNA-Thr(GGU) m(6)t(6)A37 methyltransferase TsaA
MHRTIIMPLCCFLFIAVVSTLYYTGNPQAGGADRFAEIVKKNAANIKKRYATEEIKKMAEKRFSFRPIGAFHSPLTPETGAPRQGRLAPEIEATIEILPEFENCLEGIEKFSHIHVLFIFDRSRRWSPKVRPPSSRKARGLFSTRSPNRPNPIGVTAARLIKREGRILHVAGIDAFDDTPVVDIKPYVSRIDSFEESAPEK